MFSREDILKQLRDGADPQEIATAMADAINGALGDYQKEQDEAAYAEKEKRKDARKVVDAMSDFFTKYFGEDPIDEDALEAATDAMIEMTDHMIGLKNDLSAIAVRFQKPDREPSAPDAEDEIDDDILRRFLASL